MKIRKYEYLVSYHFCGGSGTTYIIRDKAISSIADAKNVENFIEEKNHLENVGIITFVLLRKYKVRV